MELVDRSNITATRRGTVHVDFGRGKRTVIKTYLLPQLKLNLLSCSILNDYCMSIKFEKGKYVFSDIKSDNRVFRTVRKRDSDGLFTAKINSMESS